MFTRHRKAKREAQAAAADIRHYVSDVVTSLEGAKLRFITLSKDRFSAADKAVFGAISDTAFKSRKQYRG